jgi:hypothetical protein
LFPQGAANGKLPDFTAFSQAHHGIDYLIASGKRSQN